MSHTASDHAECTRGERVAVSGASGLIGSQLAAQLESQGHHVQPLVRRDPRPGSSEIRWDPARGELDADALAGVSVVVNLAGESIAAGRWTNARKAVIRDSRVDGTRLLAEHVARLEPPPRVFICASATGYYGDRGDELLTEDSAPGSGFLAEVCRAWEAATRPAADAGIRVVCLRTSMVLSSLGGALTWMLRPFKLGLGGRLGSGRQYVSWISLEDLVAAIVHAMEAEDLAGPMNATSPQPVTNAEFTRTLGEVLGRPTPFPMPAAMVGLMFGEMGRALMLSSTRAMPQKLLGGGFKFSHPDLRGALEAELKRTAD